MTTGIQKNKIQDWLPRLSLLVAALLGLLSITYFDGTGDDGDSIFHYLIARYAPEHLELYFHHWGKPVFTLLASPFAQFGFDGIKVFNLICTLIALWTTYRLADQLKIVNAHLLPLVYMVAPLPFILTFSGLTEPLFAAVLVGAIYFFSKEKYVSGALLLSLLPFVRSEGLLFIGLAGGWLLLYKHFKAVPFLAFGHLVYAVAGWSVHGSPLWVVKSIPYYGTEQAYGSGTWWHFPDQLPYVLGIPVYVLTAIGLLYYLWAAFQRRWNIIPLEWALVFGGFIVFFGFHALAWQQGLFHSMGLKRVFVGVMPLMAIAALRGWNGILVIAGQVGYAVQSIVLVGIAAYLVIFPFTPNHAAINFDKDLRLNADQHKLLELADQWREEVASAPKVSYNAPYLHIALDQDPFGDHFSELTKTGLGDLPVGTMVIWDNWNSTVERGISESLLDNSPRFNLLQVVSYQDEGRRREFRVGVMQ